MNPVFFVLRISFLNLSYKYFFIFPQVRGQETTISSPGEAEREQVVARVAGRRLRRGTAKVGGIAPSQLELLQPQSSHWLCTAVHDSL